MGFLLELPVETGKVDLSTASLEIIAAIKMGSVNVNCGDKSQQWS
jgi:hypothetical protein